jgi:hypothetical protein
LTQQSDRQLRAIELAEAALELCDDEGLFMAAIDLSSAIDKLKAVNGITPQAKVEIAVKIFEG